MCAKRSRFVFPLDVLYLSFSHAHSLTAVCDTPGCWFVVGCFGVFPMVLCRAMALVLRFAWQGRRFFDTPVDVLFCNGSRGVREGPGCVVAGFRVD